MTVAAARYAKIGRDEKRVGQPRMHKDKEHAGASFAARITGIAGQPRIPSLCCVVMLCCVMAWMRLGIGRDG